MPKLYPTPPGDSVQPIVDAIGDVRRRQREIERPSGTNLNSLVAQVQAALANINATVAAAIAANSYTKVVIDGLIANPPLGSAVTGNISATGAISAGGVATFPAGVSSLDARNRVLSTGFAGAWIDSSGRFGIQPSSQRFKKNIAPWSTDISKLLELRRVTFRYIVAIDDDPDAMSKPKQLGFIAEEVVALGFPEFVFYDEDGDVQGLNYDRMVVALLELAVWEHEQNRLQFEALNARLTAGGL